MRTGRGWFDSVSLDLWYPWILAAIVALLMLASECSRQPAYAGEWSLNVGAGATFFNRTIEDGTWIQKGLPHSTDLQDFAYRAGVSYAFNDRYSLQLNYLNMGTARLSNSYVVEDHEYDAKSSTCLIGGECLKRGPFHTTDTMQGGEISLTRTWHLSALQPFVRVGAALMMHHIHVEAGTGGYTLDMHGKVPMGLVGAGLCYHWACVDTTYYHGPGGMNCLTPCGLPISKELLVTMVSVKVAL